MRARPTTFPALSAPLFGSAFAVTVSVLGLAGCTRSCGSESSDTEATGGAQADGAPTLTLYPPDAGPDDPSVAQHFQGTIDMRLEDMHEQGTAQVKESVPPATYQFSARGDSYRWDMYQRSTPRGDFRIYDQSAQRIYTVLPSETVILSTPISGDEVNDASASFVLEDLHQKGAVAGHACDRFRTKQGSKRYELCTTPDLLPFPFHMLPGLMHEVIPFGEELFARKVFPLLVNEFEDADAGAPLQIADASILRGTPLARFRVTAMEQTRIDPNKFVLPKYRLQMTQHLQTSTQVVH